MPAVWEKCIAPATSVSIEIRSKAADGSGAEEILLAKQDHLQFPGSWSPDGKFLAYTSLSPDIGLEVSVLEIIIPTNVALLLMSFVVGTLIGLTHQQIRGYIHLELP